MADYNERKKRNLIESFNDLSEVDKEDILDTIKYDGALKVAMDVVKTKTVSFGDMYDEATERQKYFNKYEGMGTGMQYFDAATMGFRPGEVTVIAGAPNLGKTMVSMNIVVSAAEQTLKKVLIVSLEMTKSEVMSRVYNMSDDHEAAKPNILVQTDLNVSCEHVARIIERDKPDMVMIDHLQFLANSERGSEYERVGAAIAKVKRLAIKKNIPIILISHINKSRSGSHGEATTADLKGAANIEQDADIIIMLNQPSDNVRAVNPNSLIVTLLKHRTKKPLVFKKDCLINFNGVKVANDGAYNVLTEKY